ncbi:hypothetical protein NM688_g6076 [Phlebia brevispora]|uniref:Uncharacterized protein n=1 Tax=Phlebia brevispora TaxID=194682 RepID=A0ACC1SK56_9APHY|nr:hypothetical protein NM688_g6076 [Phlebia brevispora]
MSASLSPEQYLRYPVEVCLVNRSEPTESQGAENENEHLPWKCKRVEYYRMYENPWVGALRSARFESIVSDADLELLNNCEDITNTYCVPIVKVVNSVVLKSDVPQLRMLRIPESKGGNPLSHPIAVLYSGMQDTDPFSETAPLQVDRWHKRTVPRDDEMEGKEPHAPDWTAVNKCFAVVVFLHPGEFFLGDICVEHRNNTRAVVGILTDELTSLVVNYLPCLYDEDLPELINVPSSTTGLRILISSFMYGEAATWRLVRIYPTAARRFLQGAAMDQASVNGLLNNSQVKSKRWFSDFDLYTMQRVPELWHKFASWRHYVQEEGIKHLISPGMAVTFEPDGFARRVDLLRSPYPYRPLPQETLDSVMTSRERRPRNTTLDRIVYSSQDIELIVHECIRTGANHFSQVFSAYVIGCDELVCVKLFDERFFCIPQVDEDECTKGPFQSRLGSLHYSEDLARHEESVYHRLSALQGTLLPHCYGFHLFTLPDGWQCYGLIMEKIEGPPLVDAFNAGSQTTQALLLSHIRHGVRALRAAGISQRDWHLNQILCSLRSDEHPEIVFIDFGFSEMYVGDEDGTPTTGDLLEVLGLLGLGLDVDYEMLRQQWLPPLEFEY